MRNTQRLGAIEVSNCLRSVKAPERSKLRVGSERSGTVPGYRLRVDDPVVWLSQRARPGSAARGVVLP
jgi:hypothetical protein